MERSVSSYSAAVPAKAGTQYSPTLAIKPRPYGVLDACLRGHDGGARYEFRSGPLVTFTNASYAFPPSPRVALADAAAGWLRVESFRPEAMPAAADLYPALMISGVKLSSARAGEHFFLLSRETTAAHSRQRLREAVRAARRQLRGQPHKAANSRVSHGGP